jgi:hypothetical protein
LVTAEKERSYTLMQLNPSTEAKHFRQSGACLMGRPCHLGLAVTAHAQSVSNDLTQTTLRQPPESPS